MGTEAEELHKLAKKLGYRISKKKKPKGTSLIKILVNGAFGGVAAKMIKEKVKSLTIRKIMKRTIKDKFFNSCLDECFKGPKRAAFDDNTEKEYNTDKEYFIKDIITKGEFKRYKLLERTIKLDMNAVRTLLDDDYRPAGDKVIVHKRKYKKS
tara:strand:- start:25 stop:483 length:459 start_codon:yes stop_codon:yes gene_type:complete